MSVTVINKTPRPSRVSGETGWLIRLVLYAVLGLFAFMTIYPMVWLLINSFKTTQAFQLDRLGLPTRWYWANYPSAWRIGEFSILFGNSVFYTTVSTAAIVFFSMTTGFAFAKLRSSATKFFHGSFILGILLTVQSILIPLFLLANWTGLF